MTYQDGLLDEIEWTPDCQDKWDFDGGLLTISTRLWGNKGGTLCFNTVTREMKELIEEKASAKCYFMFGGEDLLESGDIEADTNDECKKLCEQWYKDNFRKAISLLVEKIGGV